jgi:hypothetical protein
MNQFSRHSFAFVGKQLTQKFVAVVSTVTATVIHTIEEVRMTSLNGFDPLLSYPAYEGMTPVSTEAYHDQMKAISDLIGAMMINGAKQAELSRAIRHSQVVLGSEKHNLDYKQSAVDHGIAQLTAKYQGVPND